MIRAKKIRLFPTEEQEQKMWQSVGIAKFIYNWTLGKQQVNYKQGGKYINKTRVIKQLEKRLRRLQRKVSKKYQQNKNGKEYVKTSNIVELERQIKLLHRRLANIRSNHLHQARNRIVKTKPTRIVLEVLNIKGMMKNKHLSKEVA